MSRFTRYENFITGAQHELRIGGDTEKAKVWAMLAQAEIIAVTESDGKLEISGELIVNS